MSVVTRINNYIKNCRVLFQKDWQKTKKTKLITKPRVVWLLAVLFALLALLLFYNRPNAARQNHDGITAEPKKIPPKQTDSITLSKPESKAKSELIPADILNLANWRLTLPVDTSIKGSPDEISQPMLAKYSWQPYFAVNTAGNAVVFRAHTGGQTTKNSKYPRSELREMTSGGQEAAWSNASGVHVMVIKQAVTHLPAIKPEVVAGQIHDESDDVIMIRLKSRRLYVESGGKSIGVLEENYTLGKVFTVRLIAQNGQISVDYNGIRRVNLSKVGSGYYFKAGCYTQSNPSKGDDPNSYGEVVIYGLEASHS